jgi:hypothetical protein
MHVSASVFSPCMLHKHLSLNLIVLSPNWAYLLQLIDWLRDGWQHFRFLAARFVLVIALHQTKTMQLPPSSLHRKFQVFYSEIKVATGGSRSFFIQAKVELFNRLLYNFMGCCVGTGKLHTLYQSFFYLPTDAQLNCLKNNFKIYIKTDNCLQPQYQTNHIDVF